MTLSTTVKSKPFVDKDTLFLRRIAPRVKNLINSSKLAGLILCVAIDGLLLCLQKNTAHPLIDHAITRNEISGLFAIGWVAVDARLEILCQKPLSQLQKLLEQATNHPLQMNGVIQLCDGVVGVAQ